MGFTVYWSRQSVSSSVFERFRTLLPDMLEHSTVQSTVSEVVLVPNEGSDSTERFWTRESCSGGAFAKTSRTPYTTDVMRACILMVELNMARLDSLYNDDEEEFSWTTQLVAVNRHFPLESYDKQASHFVKKDIAAVLYTLPLKKQVEAVQTLIHTLKTNSTA